MPCCQNPFEVPKELAVFGGTPRDKALYADPIQDGQGRPTSSFDAQESKKNRRKR